MATFVFKKEKEEISLDSLTPGQLRDSFESLKLTITGQIGSIQCDNHHLEPVVVLRNDGEKAVLAGFATCCDEFMTAMRKRIKLPSGMMPPDGTITVRQLKYTHPGNQDS